MSVMIQ